MGGNQPSKKQVIEVKRIEVVKNQPDRPMPPPKRDDKPPKEDKKNDRSKDMRSKEPTPKPQQVEKKNESQSQREPQQQKKEPQSQKKEPPLEKKGPQLQKEPQLQKREPQPLKKEPPLEKKGPQLQEEPQLQREPLVTRPPPVRNPSHTPLISPKKSLSPPVRRKTLSKSEEQSSIYEEPEYQARHLTTATVTNDVPAKESLPKKLMNAIGISQLPLKSFILMLFLWSLRFFIPWVSTWWNFNIFLLADPSHMEREDSYFFTHEIIAFICTCIICFLAGLFGDVFNLKYYGYLFFIAIYILCPITALAAINYLWARGYNRIQYARYAPTAIVAMNWAMAVPFVAFPLEFCCFFTQAGDMSREAHYNWAAIFVFLDCLNRLICFYVIPPKCPSLQWTLATVWIVIGIIIYTVFLLSCFLIMWIRRENKALNRTDFVLKVVKQLNKFLDALNIPMISERPQGDTKDELNAKATPFMRKMKLILLGLMVVPVIYASFVIATLHRLELDEDWDRREFHGATSMFVFGRVIGVLVVGVIIFILRRQRRLKRYDIFRADVMALGLPHLLITLALLIITIRFATLQKLEEGSVVVGPVPSEESGVVEFYNADFRNRTICVWSKEFRPVKVRPRKRETRNPGNLAIDNVEIHVTSAPRTTPPVTTVELMKGYKADSLLTFVVALNISEGVNTDLEAVYNKYVVFRVTGTETLKPKSEPQLVLINSFILETDGYGWTVNQFQSNFSEKRNLKPREEAEVIALITGSGRVDITFQNEGAKQEQKGPVKTFIEMENYTVYAVVLGLAHPMANSSNATEPYSVILTSYKMFEVAGPDRNPLPSKRELQQDRLVIVGMILGGIAEAGLFIGYLYLFWLDNPIPKMRASILACFAIALAVPQQFPRLRLLDITTGVAIFLLCVQVMFTIMHFIGAIFLYDESFDFRKFQEKLDLK